MRELPKCVRCDGEVESMDDSFVNSPYKATAFMTHGHYGSTIFDPMNGTFLEVNLCDECIKKLAGRGQILMGQDFKRVLCEGAVIGKIPVSRELVPWHPGLEVENDERDVLQIEPHEVGSDLYPEIIYSRGIVEAYREGEEVD